MILDEREHPDPAGAGRRPGAVAGGCAYLGGAELGVRGEAVQPSLRVAMIEATEARRGVPLR